MQQAQQQQIEAQNQQLRIQQEQEEQKMINNRPEEHFLTIALNGTYPCSFVWLLGYYMATYGGNLGKASG